MNTSDVERTLFNFLDQNITVSQFSQIVKHYFFFGVFLSELKKLKL